MGKYNGKLVEHINIFKFSYDIYFFSFRDLSYYNTAGTSSTGYI